jgi:hypothetical protein
LQIKIIAANQPNQNLQNQSYKFFYSSICVGRQVIYTSALQFTDGD